MWIFLIGICIVLLGISFYLVTRIHKLEFIYDMKNKKLSWFLSILPIVIALVLSYFIGLGITVYLIHLAIFLSIGDIIYLIHRKKSDKPLKYYKLALVMLVINTIYILYALANAYNVKQTDYVLKSDKVNDAISIVEIADSHLGTTINGKEFGEFLYEISGINPDALVIVGDFVDENTPKKDMQDAIKALGKVKTKYGVYIVWGNHDLSTYGGNKNYTSNELIEELKKNKINILEDEAVLINDEFYIVGRQDKTVTNRKSIIDLTKDLDKSKYIISLDHQPVDYDNEISGGVDLVLSGHSHGGQMIPLSLISTLVSDNEMVYGLKEKNNTTFITTSGMSGWGIPFKTGTISEFVHIIIR